MVTIPIGELLGSGIKERLRLTLVAGKKGLSREITTPRIQKPGLLLTDPTERLHPNRIQILGKAEINYLNSVPQDRLEVTLRRFVRDKVICLVVTRGQRVPPFLSQLAERARTPLLKTTLTTSLFIERVTKFLEERLAPSTTLHGVLVDVLGVGILILGKSGIGKSECALDLITRGYRLIADDVVSLKRMPPSTILGMATDVIRYHMEVRGLGIVNIKDIFGITAIREKKQLDLVVELVEWNPEKEYERLGFEEGRYGILGVELPLLRIPVSPGRSVATIVEVAARNQILKIMGYHPALEFQRQLNKAITMGRAKSRKVRVKRSAPKRLAKS